MNELNQFLTQRIEALESELQKTKNRLAEAENLLHRIASEMEVESEIIKFEKL